MPKYKRRRLWVDPQVQGAFLWRTFFYWVASVSVVAIVQFTWRTVAIALGQLPADDATVWNYAGPAIATTVFLMPAFVFDFLRLTNQLVGPVSRMRRTIRQALSGEHVEPLKFRDGDFWQDFAEEINALLRRLDELQAAAEREQLEEVSGAAAH